MAIADFISKFGGMTESYWFYTDSSDPIELRYDPKDHVYLLTTPEGLERQDGVTTVVHIIDKSDALVPWGCKMMYQKLLRTMPFTDSISIEEGQEIIKRYTIPMTFDEFDKIAFEAKKAHEEKLEDAGEVGHIAHAWIESYIKIAIESRKYLLEYKGLFDDNVITFLNYAIQWQLDNMPKDERSANACRAALDWMNRHNVRWLETERKIYSRKYKYAGTMDGLCVCDSCDDVNCCPETFKDRLSVADWKTSNCLYLEYLFQTAAYEQAYEEEFGVDIKDRWLVRLGKDDGEFEAWHLEAHNFEDDFGGFLDALDLTRRVRRIKDRISAKKADIRAALKAERDEVRRLKDEQEALERAEAREKKRKERVEALKLKCTRSEKYKGTRKPSCVAGEDGEPCVSCAFKYAKTQETKFENTKSHVKKVSGGAFPHKGDYVCTDSTSTAPIAKMNTTTQIPETLRQNGINSSKLSNLVAVLVPKKAQLLLPAPQNGLDSVGS